VLRTIAPETYEMRGEASKGIPVQLDLVRQVLKVLILANVQPLHERKLNS
jgi:hypothetical protein